MLRKLVLLPLLAAWPAFTLNPITLVWPSGDFLRNLTINEAKIEKWLNSKEKISKLKAKIASEQEVHDQDLLGITVVNLYTDNHSEPSPLLMAIALGQDANLGHIIDFLHGQNIFHDSTGLLHQAIKYGKKEVLSALLLYVETGKLKKFNEEYYNFVTEIISNLGRFNDIQDIEKIIAKFISLGSLIDGKDNQNLFDYYRSKNAISILIDNFINNAYNPENKDELFKILDVLIDNKTNIIFKNKSIIHSLLKDPCMGNKLLSIINLESSNDNNAMEDIMGDMDKEDILSVIREAITTSNNDLTQINEKLDKTIDEDLVCEIIAHLRYHVDFSDALSKKQKGKTPLMIAQEKNLPKVVSELEKYEHENSN